VQPAPGGETAVVEDRGGEEIEDVGMVCGEGTVAGSAGVRVSESGESRSSGLF
jgi:hypothetical protein